MLGRYHILKCKFILFEEFAMDGTRDFYPVYKVQHQGGCVQFLSLYMGVAVGGTSFCTFKTR